jgi:hypothetical protein
MTVEALVLCGVLAALMLVGILAPFRRGGRASAAAMAYQRQRDALLVYYQQVTSSLRDLDDDFHAGRLSNQDYADDRERWMQRGVQILRALDELDAANPALAQAAVAQDDVEQHIEAAVRRYIDEQTSLKTTAKG